MADRPKVLVTAAAEALWAEREYAAEVLRQSGFSPREFSPKSDGDRRASRSDVLTGTQILLVISSEDDPTPTPEVSRAKALGIPTISLMRAAAPRSVSSRPGQGELRYFTSLGDLRREIDAALAQILLDRFSPSRVTSVRALSDDVYYECQRYVESAESFLGSVQRTASLVLGPHIARTQEESRFLIALQRRLAESAGSKQSPSGMFYLFDAESTLAELIDRPESYPHAREALEWLEDFMAKRSDFAARRIVPIASGCTPLVLQDDTLALAARIGRTVWFEQRMADSAADFTKDNLVNAAATPSVALVQFVAAARGALSQYARRDRVQLVDSQGQFLRLCDKSEAHAPPGLLHLGYSVFLFSRDGQVLLQRRAETKYHFAGLTSNACCSHTPEGVTAGDAAKRRLREELGLELESDLESVGKFQYREVDPVTGLVEFEYDEVLVGELGNAEISYNKSEVAGIKFLSVDELLRDLVTHPGAYTPWLREALQIVLDGGYPRP